MTSAEKILTGIIDEAKAKSQSIIDKANSDAQKIIADAEKQCDQLNKATELEIERQTALLQKTGESAAALILRDAALAGKRENIEKTLNKAQETILAMPDNEYFELLLAVVKNSGAAGGTLMLNAKDMKRNTADFAKALSDKNISLSSDTADIEGGFILKNGDIEINASISALIHEMHGELVDNANRILFNREGEA